MADPVIVRCRENGPLVLPGTIQVFDHLGNPFPIPAGKETIALCRCGHSNRKPFCDGMHKQANFQAAQTAPAAQPPAEGAK